MPRGSAAASRANLDLAPGGDRFADKRVIVDAIRAAFEGMDNDAELREFFGLHNGRQISVKHRRRWAKAKAKKTYEAIVSSMRRGLLGDKYKGAELTEEEKAEIEAKINDLRNAGGWDGETLAPEYEEDLRLDLEEAAAEGLSDDELDALELQLRAEYVEDMHDAGYIVGEVSEDDIKQRRKELIIQAKNIKKVKLNEMGSLKISDFLTIEPRKENPLYPKSAMHKNRAMGSYVWSYYMGVEPGYGDFPLYDLLQLGYWVQPSYPVLGNGHVGFWRLSSSTYDNLAPVVDSVIAVRLAWMFKIRLLVEKTNEVIDLRINAFPGWVFAQLREECSTEEDGRSTGNIIECKVKKYLTSSEALLLHQQWGNEFYLRGSDSGSAGEIQCWDGVVSEFFGLDGDGEQNGTTVDTMLLSSYSKNEKQLSNIKLGLWRYDFPWVGTGMPRTPEVIAEAFPRRQWLGAGGAAAKKWVSRDEWGSEESLRYMHEHYPEVYMPPLNKPQEKIRYVAKFSEEFRVEIDD